MTERHGAAHRIVTTKSQDQSQHHQITNAPNSRELQGSLGKGDFGKGPPLKKVGPGRGYYTAQQERWDD